MPNIQKNVQPKHKTKQATSPVLYRLPPDDLQRLDKIAQILGHTRSSISRHAMKKFIVDTAKELKV